MILRMQCFDRQSLKNRWDLTRIPWNKCDQWWRLSAQVLKQKRSHRRLNRSIQRKNAESVHSKGRKSTELKTWQKNEQRLSWLQNSCYTKHSQIDMILLSFSLTCSWIHSVNIILAYSIWYRFERLQGKSQFLFA